MDIFFKKTIDSIRNGYYNKIKRYTKRILKGVKRIMTNLKQLRKEHSLNQTEIAELIGISKTGYAAKENGNRKFTIPEALTISKFFDVPVEQIQNFLTISIRNEYKAS